MNDNELRALVRESIARQLGGRPADPAWSGPASPAMPDPRRHASHAVYMIPRDGGDGPCIIEPAVPCTHCDYCKSHGH